MESKTHQRNLMCFLFDKHLSIVYNITKMKGNDMNHFAIVCQLEQTRVHPNADRLKLSSALGYQVIVGLDAKDGDLVILFPDDLQLSEQFCYENNLNSSSALNKDTTVKGYFNKARRVKCQNFRNQKSEAFVVSPEAFAFTGIKSFNVGDKFQELNGIPICNKYITPATAFTVRNNQPKQEERLVKRLKKIFREHVDTTQLRFVSNEQLMGNVIVTGKTHGSSGRSGCLQIPCDVELTWVGKLKYAFIDSFFDYGKKHIFNFWLSEDAKEGLRERPTENKFKSIFGTRRVIRGEALGDTYREEVHKAISPWIKKGETFFYEIVGYEGSTTPIMQSVSTECMPKDFQKKFGNPMTYTYGCKPYQFDFYVYRITTQNEFGDVYELSWNQVKERCKNSGIKYVPELFTMYVDSDEKVGELKARVESLVENELEDFIDSSHIREGVVLRIENEKGTKFVKSKSYIHRLLEGVIKDNPEYVDAEEEQGNLEEENN